MKTLFLMLVIGSLCLAARAADPDDNKPTEKHIIVTTVKEAHKLPAATASKTPEAKGESYNITVFDADPTAKKLNINTASDKAIKFLIAANAEAAQPTPFKDKIVRVQVAAGNRNEIFTLENVRLTTLLGSEFIVGTAVKYGTDRFSGLEVYLKLRDVLTIVAMTPEQAKKFNEMQRPRSGQGPYNPQQGGQGPYNPQQGGQGFYNPPPGGQGPYNPPQGGQGPYNPPQGFNPPQGGQGPYNPPQGGHLPPRTPTDNFPSVWYGSPPPLRPSCVI